MPALHRTRFRADGQPQHNLGPRPDIGFNLHAASKLLNYAPDRGQPMPHAVALGAVQGL